jgi:phytol kinase
MNNLVGILISVLFVALVIGASTMLQKAGRLSGEGARKFIHIGVGNWWLIAMYTFDSPLWAAVVPLLFVAVNALSRKYTLISAMERTGKDAGWGTVYYAVSLLILALFTFGPPSRPYVGALGALAMAYGDGFAAVLGQKYGRTGYRIGRNRKSWIGSAACFGFTFLASLIVLMLSGRPALTPSLILAALAAILEAVTPFELDNLTVPLGVALFYQLAFFR